MNQRRLLVVDDEDMICELVRAVAEPLGFEVSALSNPLEFERVYADFAPTDIVLDIVMPERDGMEILGWLARQGTTARVSIMTGYNPHYATLASSLAGGFGLNQVHTFQKPISIATLRAHLRGHEAVSG